MAGDDPEEWLAYARDDLKWAEVSFAADLFSRAAFACQQAAEKAIKAYLVQATGAYPEYMHFSNYWNWLLPPIPRFRT